jgi:hypothetical protein
MAGFAGHLVLAGKGRDGQEFDRGGLNQNDGADQDEDCSFHL